MMASRLQALRRAAGGQRADGTLAPELAHTSSDASAADRSVRTTGGHSGADWIFIAALCAGAFALRFCLATASGLSIDEVQTVRISTLPEWGDVLEFLSLHDSHPPLFYVLIRAWSGVVGRSEAGLLVITVGLGAAIVPLLYAVGRALGGRRTAIAAAVLGAVLPVLVEYGMFLRPYTLLPLLALGATCTLWRAGVSGGLAAWAAYSALAAALLWTHAWSAVFLGAQALVILARAAGTRDARFLWCALGAGVVATALYSPWIPALVHQSQAVGYPPAAGSLLARIWVSTMSLARTGLSIRRAVTIAPASVPAAALFVVAAWVMGQLGLIGALLRRSRVGAPGRAWAVSLLAAVPLLAVMLAALLAGKADVLQERCYVMLVPLVTLAMAWGLAEIASASRIGFILLLAMLAGAFAYADVTRTTAKSNARDLATVVDVMARPGDLLLEVPGYRAGAMNHYLSSSLQRIDFPSLGPEPLTRYDGYWRRLLDPRNRDAAEALLREAHAEGRGVWLITDRSILAGSWPSEVGTGSTIWEVEGARTQQFRRFLDGLYGRPGSVLIAGPDESIERLVAVRYTP